MRIVKCSIDKRIKKKTHFTNSMPLWPDVLPPGGWKNCTMQSRMWVKPLFTPNDITLWKSALEFEKNKINLYYIESMFLH